MSAKIIPICVHMLLPAIRRVRLAFVGTATTTCFDDREFADASEPGIPLVPNAGATSPFFADPLATDAVIGGIVGFEDLPWASLSTPSATEVDMTGR